MPMLPGMALAGQPDIWRERLNTLNEVIDFVDKRPPVDRQDTLHRLLLQLKRFGSKQFDFFHDGFSAKVNAHQLENRADDLQAPSAEYVFGTITHQIANDIVVLQRIQEQRNAADEKPDPLMHDTLTEADQLAYIALRQLALFLPHQAINSVLCYFHLFAHTRVLPYAPVAMIGIPMSAPRVKRDLLAIPHELGHYLYWHGNISHFINAPNASLRFNVIEKLVPPTSQAQNPSAAETPASSSSTLSPQITQLLAQHHWLKPWAEEVFADVVSCLLAGPISALYLQDMLLQTRNDWMYMDDGIYPIAAIRPLIHSQTFKTMFPGSVVGSQLETRWLTKLQERGTASAAFYPYVHPFTQAGISYVHPTADGQPELRIPAVLGIETMIQAVTHQVVQLISSVIDNQQWQSNPWYLPLDDLNLALATDVEVAYKRFVDEHIDRVLTHFSTLQDSHLLDQPWEPLSWFDLIQKLNIKDDVESTDHSDTLSLQEWFAVIKRWHDGDPIASSEHIPPIPPKIWKRILEFAGWTTEGPTDGNLTS